MYVGFLTKQAVVLVCANIARMGSSKLIYLVPTGVEAYFCRGDIMFTQCRGQDRKHDGILLFKVKVLISLQFFPLVTWTMTLTHRGDLPWFG